MRRKWVEGRFGVKLLVAADEFVPRHYRARVFDLRTLGVSTVPVIGQTSYREIDEPSPWHVHKDCLEFIYCTAGACEYESDGHSYCLRPGMVFFSRPSEEHRQLDCPKGYSTFYLHFKPSGDAFGRWFGRATSALPRLLRCGRSVSQHFGRILALVESDRPKDELRIRLQTEIQQLLLDILDAKTAGKSRTATDKIELIAQRIEECPERNYPLDALATESGVSKTQFIVQFKEVRGYSPHAYLLRCRVIAAMALLRKGLTIQEVTERLGFPTRQNFLRTFVHYVGVSLQAWLAHEKSKSASVGHAGQN